MKSIKRFIIGWKITTILLLFFLSQASAQVANPQSKPADFLKKGLHTETENFPQYVMGLPASESTQQAFLRAHPKRSYFTFPEHRSLPIRLLDRLPQWWMREEQSLISFEAEARPGEFYVFQIGVFAARKSLKNLRVDVKNLQGPDGSSITSSSFTTFNTEGIDSRGNYFRKQVDVPKGKIQPLWVGVYIPEQALGRYSGTVTVKPKDVAPTEISLSLSVQGEPIQKHGDREEWRLSRMRWLNSRVANDEQVTQPYIPVERKQQKISILGRSLELGDNGLPVRLQSYFSASNTRITQRPKQILAGPMEFSVIRNGEKLQWNHGSVNFSDQSPSKVAWEATGQQGPLQMKVSGRMEYDGFVEYDITLRATEEVALDDVQLRVPMSADASTYMMGLGHQGGHRPKQWNWSWNREKHQDKVWIGGVNAGLRLKFKAQDYQRPLVNIYYEYGPLTLPESWHNKGKGSIKISEQKGGGVLLNASSGERIIPKGATVHFNVEMLITPLKLLNTQQHWADRYYHKPNIETADSIGANIVNIHHANKFNPFINYPYYERSFDGFKELVADAHQRGVRIKPYYTTRELTVELPEFWALRSLGGEIIYPGPGNEVKTILHPEGPAPWLKENVKQNYIPAWVHEFNEGPYAGQTDLSVLTTPDSRWNNFYVKGLQYLVEEARIDGMYIDDTALDRYTLRRARKVLDRNRPEPRIDMHSWNHFNDMAGWASSANLYMDLFPYIDRLWLGEMFDYSKASDYWLVEVSGIPFGMMSEMLQDGGNPWRGMIYGMTIRAPWDGDPTPIWKLWDTFGIHKSQMIPYWSPNSPIKSGNDKVKATSYVRKGDSTLLILASWADSTVDITAQIDWDVIGLDSTNAVIEAPGIEGLQEASQFQIDETLSIEPAKGKMLIIKEK